MSATEQYMLLGAPTTLESIGTVGYSISTSMQPNQASSSSRSNDNNDNDDYQTYITNSNTHFHLIENQCSTAQALEYSRLAALETKYNEQSNRDEAARRAAYKTRLKNKFHFFSCSCKGIKNAICNFFGRAGRAATLHKSPSSPQRPKSSSTPPEKSNAEHKAKAGPKSKSKPRSRSRVVSSSANASASYSTTTEAAVVASNKAVVSSMVAVSCACTC